jgi:hypothetical protein
MWTNCGTFLAELQTIILPLKHKLKREEKATLLEPFFTISAAESEDW